ncbi:hypothetical protein MML48_3g00001665 [Holotrichia oblita]|uniref:Uncharacterized protein n=1 Tax=Holotrichia oblita TaxID=644536 RepID=A0ACB9TCE1_HOLOL|nr:hypothetical protein MML48_3g00001665 [Holotrichia oblita]
MHVCNLEIKETIRKYSNPTACKQPNLPLNSPEIMEFLHDVPPINCKSGTDWVQCKGSECSIKEQIETQKGKIKCSFTNIIRTDDFQVADADTVNTDSYYKLEESDVVNVSCVASDSTTWKSILTGIRLNKEIWDRSGWQYVPQDGLKLNVLMFGFDSISRNTFIRKLPKSYDYLVNHLGGLVLKGYNIVGDGTPQALTPILTGKTELELPDVRKRFLHTQNVDVYPFIWKDFQENGYVTAFLEDLPSTGIYQYRLNGFLKQPTDHYMRPYYITIAKEIYKWPRFCVGETPRHKVMLNYIEQFFSVYKSKPKFLFGFHGELSHDNYNLIGAVDDDVLQFLKNLNSSGALNDTVLILMADHGHRFGKIRNTIQGKQEERLPFFSFRFPDWFTRKHEEIYKNFQLNLNTLTTPFDIHSTLKDILEFRSPTDGDLKNRAISLFSKIPSQRSCVHANIEPHWCACMDWENVDLTLNIATRLADTFIATVNNYTADHREICASLRVSKIEWVTKMKPNEQLVKFSKNLDVDGFVADLSGHTNVLTHTYQIKLQAVPGDSIFEASITHYLKDDRLDLKISDISRVNKYGTQARCIEHTYPNLRKYCYCLGD